MTLDRLYQQIILDHNRAPRNFAPLPGATHSARGLDALCGDDIRIELIVAGGRIERAAFTGEACAVTKAATSMLTEWLPGHDISQFEAAYRRFADMFERPEAPAAGLGELDELRAVAEFPARVANALLPWRTVARALKGNSLIR